MQNLLLLLVLSSLLIIAHELAHFLMAGALGIPIKQFSIGVGAVVWRWRSMNGDGSECEWEIHALPVSGFVRFETKYSPWKRALVYFAGPMMNLLLAVALVGVSVAVSGGSLSEALFHLLKGDAAKSHDPLVLAANFSKFLGLMNLLPLAGFDGAQCLALVLRGFLQRKALTSQVELEEISQKNAT